MLLLFFLIHATLCINIDWRNIYGYSNNYSRRQGRCISRTNNTKTTDSRGITFNHDKTHGYLNHLGSDTDYSGDDDNTSDRRSDSNLLMGNQNLIRSGGTGGNVKEMTSYTKGKDSFVNASDSATIALGSQNQLLYVDGGTIKAYMNPSTTTTNAPILTNGGGAGGDGDTGAGLGSYNSGVTFYAMTSPGSGPSTYNVSLSNSK